jgi:hypothetical protein
MTQEFVSLGWTETVVHNFNDVRIDADKLREIVKTHAPRLDGQPGTEKLSEVLDWLNDQELSEVVAAVKAHLAEQGSAPEGELDSESVEDLTHDAGDLSEHDECEGGCGYHPDDCECDEDDDDEDEDDDDDQDDDD